jgi:isopentenyl-diphosphate delta-isomerase
MEQVILVDEDVREIGTMEKMEAHLLGKLHRAFSILVFNSRGELMLQKRAKTKYHSGGLWTNTCCSHPRPGEPINHAVQRKLRHEMGIDVEPLFSFKFVYKVALDNNLIENEIDYVFTATYDGLPLLNNNEVEDWRFESMSNIREQIKNEPEQFTVWFKKIVDMLREAIHL